MSDHQANYPIATMCRVLRVSPGGFYAWRTRPWSIRDWEDGVLLVLIQAAHKRSRGTYGTPNGSDESVDR